MFTRGGTPQKSLGDQPARSSVFRSTSNQLHHESTKTRRRDGVSTLFATSWFTSPSMTEQPAVPAGLLVSLQRSDIRFPSQREHMTARAILQGVLAVVAAEALAATNSLIGIDHDLDGSRFDATTEHSHVSWRVLARRQLGL